MLWIARIPCDSMAFLFQNISLSSLVETAYRRHSVEYVRWAEVEFHTCRYRRLRSCWVWERTSHSHTIAFHYCSLPHASQHSRGPSSCPSCTYPSRWWGWRHREGHSISSSAAPVHRKTRSLHTIHSSIITNCHYNPVIVCFESEQKYWLARCKH